MKSVFKAASLVAILVGGRACAQSGSGLDTATFAGGRFWTLERVFERVYGVHTVETGYTGGSTQNPVSATGGHYEAVRVSFDPTRVSYEELLGVFWRNTDPTDAEGQFTDRGAGYRTAVFYRNEAQRTSAEASRAALVASGKLAKPIVTPLIEAPRFYPAREADQGYAQKNPAAYERYRSATGRDAFLARVWGQTALKDADAPPGLAGDTYRKPTDAVLRRTLTPLQYDVTQHEGTETPWNNELWDHHDAGIYVDIVSGEPLFSSTDKYDSRTGWPSFTRPLAPGNIVEVVDRSFGMVRVEVRSKYADSHLGHLFADGPAPTRLRYCMNSASLRFVAAADLEKLGYGQYAYLFRG